MDIDIRYITSDELRPWFRLMIGVFGEDVKDSELEMLEKRAELDRAFAAFDGDRMVATAGAFTFGMTVPGGGLVTQAGITAVTVLPTHRRRMLLTRMMERQLNEVAERGEPLATLWASESDIYGRFGYGVAIEGSELEIERHRAVLRSEGPSDGTVRLVDAETARGMVPAIYEAATVGIPGTISRTDREWNMTFYDPEHWRSGASSARWVIYERDGEPLGYLRYRQKSDWSGNVPDHKLWVSELHAVDADAYAALHRFSFGVDLVSKITMYTRRVEEPILDLLVDRRRVVRRLGDKIWVRIVDVAGALSARRYAVDGSLVIRVVDDFGPWADGTFRLTGGPDGAECVPTDAAPDLLIPVQDLGAAYLGDSRISQAGWLGRIEGDPAAVTLAHRMFAWHVEPWCTVHF